MTPEDFGQILSAGVDEFGISLSSNSLSTLHCYYQELQKWSRKVNLIARGTSAAEIVEKHFLDSLALLQSLDSERDNVVDIGSGAGFPGLVCKAGNPLLRMSLVEPRYKRATFLRHIIRVCDLSQVTVHEQRLEEGSSIPGEQEFNCLVSRAVTDISQTLAMSKRFCRAGFRIICMKGSGYTEELAAAVDGLAGWELTETIPYQLPQSGRQRVLLTYTAKMN